MGGGKGSAKMQITDYRLSVLMGICLKVNAFRSIRVNEKYIWRGRQTTAGSTRVSLRNLFGGKKEQGGVEGRIDFMPGAATQTAPSRLAAMVGRLVSNTPAMRGKASLLFSGDSVGQGFLWTQNSPMVAQNIWVEVESEPITPDSSGDDVWIDEFSVNPAYIIYDAAVTSGIHPDDIDAQSIIDCAATLFIEKMGMSLSWNVDTDIKTFIGDINAHIQSTFYLSPSTGKWTLKLIRDDYDVGALSHYTPLNCKITDYQAKGFGETVNHLTIRWTNPETEKTETLVVQDIGNIEIQGGTVVTDNREYTGFRNREIAIVAGQRELRSAAAPLRTLSLQADRSAWEEHPGGVILVTYPERKFFNAVMRVLDVDYGSSSDLHVTVNCVEDIFSLNKPAIATEPPPTDWVDPSQDPTPLDAVQITTIPYYFAASADLQPYPVELLYPETMALVFGYEPGMDTFNFDLLSRGKDLSGATAYLPAGTKTVIERTLLGTALTAQTDTLTITGVRVDRGPTIDGFMFIGDDEYTAELVQIIGRESDGDWMLKRGILDTTPKPWTVGTPVWFINRGAMIADNQNIRAPEEVVAYKMLTRTSRGVLDEDDAPIEGGEVTARPHLPQRPANFKVNSTAFGSINMAAQTEIVMTWATRNRLLEDGQILTWTDASVGGEYAQHTTLQVFDVATGDMIYEYPGLYTEQTLTWPKSHFARWSSVRIRAVAKKGDLTSLQGHELTLTGLPNNPSAPLPPDPPPIGVPPSMTEAPDPDDYALLNGPLINADGSGVPALLLSGIVSSDTATRLLIRYRINVDPVDWIYHNIVKITPGRPVKVNITGLRAVTDYAVEIAYGADGEYDSDFVSMGVKNSGTFIAADVKNVGGVPVEDLITSIEDATAGVEVSLKAALQNNLSLDMFKQVQQAYNFDGVGNLTQFVAMNAEEKSDGAWTRLNIMGALTGDGSAFVIDMAKVYVGPGLSFSNYVAGVSSEFTSQDNQILGIADATSQLTTRVIDTESGLVATSSNALTALAQVGDIRAEGMLLIDNEAGSGDVWNRISFKSKSQIGDIATFSGLLLESGYTGGNPLLPFSRVGLTSDKFFIESPSGNRATPFTFDTDLGLFTTENLAVTSAIYVRGDGDGSILKEYGGNDIELRGTTIAHVFPTDTSDVRSYSTSVTGTAGYRKVLDIYHDNPLAPINRRMASGAIEFASFTGGTVDTWFSTWYQVVNAARTAVLVPLTLIGFGNDKGSDEGNVAAMGGGQFTMPKNAIMEVYISVRDNTGTYRPGSNNDYSILQASCTVMIQNW